MKPKATVYSFLSNHSYLLPIGVFGLTIGMLGLTLLPSEQLGENQLFTYDKLGHAVLFGSWSVILGLYLHIRKNFFINPWSIFGLGVGFGLLIEVLQYALPVNRHADPMDFLFDVIGCLVAVWLLKAILPEQLSQKAESKAV